MHILKQFHHPFTDEKKQRNRSNEIEYIITFCMGVYILFRKQNILNVQYADIGLRTYIKML